MQRKDYALSPAQRSDAREALLLLDGTGLSLTESARRALQGRRALHRVSVAKAVSEFLRTRLSLRSRTADWYEYALAPLLTEFGERKIDDVDRPSLVAWLKTIDSTTKRHGVTRAVRALFRWGMAREPQIVAVDPTIGLPSSSTGNGGDAEFLTVAEVGKILAGAGQYRNALALLLFAGVRPGELAGAGKPRLLWQHVRVAENMIRIPADIAKSGHPRIIEGLPDALWHWLKPGKDNEPISPGRTRQALQRAKKAIAPREWPHDATRHTFATYALALLNDAGKVSHWLGHEGKPTMLHRHYRGLTTKAEAEKFFALRPARS